MQNVQHHHLIKAELTDLRPTQITVGMAEVALKRSEWSALKRGAREALLQAHWFPAVLGPKGRHYIVDHHHLGFALSLEGVETVNLTLLDDLSYLDMPTFWRVLEWNRWAHPFDARGRRCDASVIPRRIDRLVDDPYRSLAGLVRTAGGYAKSDEPFAEFLWADYFRGRISRAAIARSLDACVRAGLELARQTQARYLPGWAGESPAR